MVKFGGHRRAQDPMSGSDDAWLSYECWECGGQVSGAVVALPKRSESPWSRSDVRWLWCSVCGAPAVRTEGGDIRPRPRFGSEVPGLTPEVRAAYDEARDCMSVNAYTGAELLCRKILMYVACEKGLPEKDDDGRAPTFSRCVDHLAGEGYVTSPMKPWVERIREHGNDATHELDPPDEAQAKSTMVFTTQMLNNIYGMQHLAEKHAGRTGDPADQTEQD